MEERKRSEKISTKVSHSHFSLLLYWRLKRERIYRQFYNKSSKLYWQQLKCFKIDFESK